MSISADLPVAGAVAAQCVTTMTSFSFDVNDKGVNAVICRVSPSDLKNAGTSARPRWMPCHGAMSLSGQDAQSTSSVSWPRMNSMSPRPNAS